MGRQIADICDGCGRTVIKKEHHESSNMVTLSSSMDNFASLLFLGKPKEGKRERPSFDLKGKLWCPQCLVDALQDWVNTLAWSKAEVEEKP